MNAIILLAGYGSRLGRDTLPHKVFLEFGNETLLSRHLKALETAGIRRTILVVGYNKEEVKRAVDKMDVTMAIDYVDNDVYRTTGNTLSLVMGLRGMDEDALVLDGDILYPDAVFQEFVKQAKGSCFGVVPVDIDDVECAKVLLGKDDTIAAIITKRGLTDEEKSKFTFGGEAIGFFTLTAEAGKLIVDTYDAREEFFEPTLWEILFSEIADQTPLTVFRIEDPGCFEIDTEEDYQEALTYYQTHPQSY